MRIVFIIIFIIVCRNVFSQISTKQSKTIYLVEEYLISLNRTEQENDINEQGATGFGFGLFHLFSVDPSADLVLGTEFNKTMYLSDYLKSGFVYYGNADLKYNINRLSIPLGVRYYFGDRVKVFFEIGSFLDINLKSTRKGYGYNYLSGDIEKIEEEIDIPTSLGIYVSLGSEFDISNLKFVIKPEYRALSEVLRSNELYFHRNYYRVSVGISINR